MAMQQITLYNPETEISVSLTVSVEDAVRAENDLQFATALMNSALEERAATTAESQQADNENTDGLYRWTTEMVLLLLDAYIEREEKFTNGKFSQKKIWEDVACAMRSKIPTITGPQCATKMRSLKKTYKSVKDHNNKSGNDRRTWLFYEKMDSIFQSKAWASPAVASSSGASSRRSDSESEVLSDSSSSRRPKENVVSLLKKRLRQKAEEEEARAKRHKERMDMDNKMLALLSKLVEKN